jgi:hypothetical protein
MHPARPFAALALAALAACAPATTTAGVSSLEHAATLPPHLLPSLVIEGDERAALVAGLTDLMARLEDRRASSTSDKQAAPSAESLAPVCLEFWSPARPARTVPDSALMQALQATTARRVLPRTQCVTTPRPLTSVAAASGAAGIPDEVPAPSTTPQEVLVSAWRYEAASAARFQAIAWYGKEGRRYECAMAPLRAGSGARWGAACEFRGLQIL